MKKEKYVVYYKIDSADWKYHGTYTKTDALGTVNLILKNADGIKVLIQKEKE